jgi:CRP-like cAMP-binding protein
VKEYAYLDANPEILVKMTETWVLDSFDEKHLTGLLKLSRVRLYEPGETIIREGECDDLVYMLLSGSIKVAKGGQSLCVLSHTGDIFGEMAIITGSPRSASIYALERTECLTLDASYMYTLSDGEKILFISTLFRVFIEVLTKRLRVMNEKFVDATRDKPLPQGKRKKPVFT